MKRLLLACCLIPSYCMAQLPDSVSVCFQPDSAIGQDAFIFKLDNNCIPNATPAPYGGNTPGVVNFGNATEIAYAAWTWSAWGCSTGEIRSLIRFDQLSSIPSNSIIQSATLSLYGVPATTNWWGNNQFPGTTLTNDNSGWLQRITSPWNEQTVSWSGTYPMPSTTTVGEKAISPSNLKWSWNTTVDVKSLVQGITNGTNSNYGWMMELQNETHYRETVFASSDNPNASLHPKLCITYKRCSDFQYCYSTNHPTQYTFTAMNPLPGSTCVWSINNVPYTVGTTFSFDFATLGGTPGSSYSIMLTSATSTDTCRKVNLVCMPVNFPDSCASFSVCRNTEAPYVANLTAITIPPTGYQYLWSVYGGTASYPSGVNGSSAIVTALGATQISATLNIQNITTGLHLCDSPTNVICFANNQLRPASEVSAYDPNVYRSTELLYQDNVETKGLSIAPNPTRDIWVLNLIAENPVTAEFHLYDLTGRMVLEQKNNLSKGANQVTIGRKNMPSGMYIIEAKIGDIVTQQKLIKID